MKLFLDRAYALGDGENWGALAGKRLAAAFTYADSNRADSGVLNAMGMIEGACRFLEIDFVGAVEASCADQGEVLENPRALEAARVLGRELAR
jgi:hypothetical protein